MLSREEMKENSEERFVGHNTIERCMNSSKFTSEGKDKQNLGPCFSHIESESSTGYVCEY